MPIQEISQYNSGGKLDKTDKFDDYLNSGFSPRHQELNDVTYKKYRERSNTLNQNLINPDFSPI